MLLQRCAMLLSSPQRPPSSPWHSSPPDAPTPRVLQPRRCCCQCRQGTSPSTISAESASRALAPAQVRHVRMRTRTLPHMTESMNPPRAIIGFARIIGCAVDGCAVNGCAADSRGHLALPRERAMSLSSSLSFALPGHRQPRPKESATLCLLFSPAPRGPGRLSY